jgi:hypothetical protein
MALALVSNLVVPLGAQNVGITRTADVVSAQAPGLGFLKGETLARLKDGRSVRVDLELAVLPGPGGPTAATGRQTYVLSYDLWEERFAVTLAGPPPRSTSYLTANAAEAWCLEHLTIPIAELGRLRDAPFWIRLEYRILDGDATPARDDSGGFTLRGLIEAFSRKPKAGTITHSLEAGPFRLRS